MATPFSAFHDEAIESLTRDRSRPSAYLVIPDRALSAATGCFSELAVSVECGGGELSRAFEMPTLGGPSAYE